MIPNHKSENFGSVLAHVPLLGYIQSKFDLQSSQDWLTNHWQYSIYASCIYLLLLWGGRKWMSSRPAFDLRRPLVGWNVGLALFSVCGMISIVPNFIHSIAYYGMDFSICHDQVLADPQQAVWAYLFVLSKVMEFGDTLFIVLRKSPLMFLHWYHHITVCMYSWYGLAHSTSALGDWFASMNYTVHSVMYSYYALKAARVRVPPAVVQFITILQITQMFIGLYVVFRNYVLSEQFGDEICPCNETVFKVGVVVYGSYAVLFVNFFYDKYCAKKTKKD